MRGKFLIILCVIFSSLIFSSSFFYHEPDKIVKARELVRRGKIDDAIKIFEKLSAKYARRDDFQFDWALAYLKKKDYSSAIDHFKLAFTNNRRIPKDVLYYNLGKTFELMKKYQDAIEMYKLALLQNPGNNAARHNLELLLRKIKRRGGGGGATKTGAAKVKKKKEKTAKSKNKKKQNKQSQAIIQSLENQQKRLPPVNQPVPEGRIDKDW